MKSLLLDLIGFDVITRMEENFIRSIEVTETSDYSAVVEVVILVNEKLGWALTEFDREHNAFFGLADLGCPELGYIALFDLESLFHENTMYATTVSLTGKHKVRLVELHEKTRGIGSLAKAWMDLISGAKIS